MRHRLRYRFDNLLARGTWASLVWLGVVTLLFVLVSSLLLDVFDVGLAGSDAEGWLEDFWQSLLRVMDAGTMASDTGWGRRVLALVITVFGLLVAGTLIGIIATGVEDRIERMRRGRTVVIETGHLVVLGATDQLPGLIRQVALGASPARPTTVVVLADADPAAIDRGLRGAEIDRRAVRVVLRSGDPTLHADLQLVRPRRARGVVVLHDGGDNDARAVRTVLAIQEVLGAASIVPVVVEVRDTATAKRLVDACGPTVHPLNTSEALARNAAFSLRGRALGPVLDELLQVGGVDIQVQDASGLDGTPFGDLVRRSDPDRPIGLFDARGRLELHPSDERIVRSGERVVTIGRAPGSPGPEHASPTLGRGRAPLPGRGSEPSEDGADGGHVMVVGWNRFGERLLAERTASAGMRSVEVVLADQDESAAVPRLPDTTHFTVVRPTSLAIHLDRRGGLEDVATVVLLPAADERGPEDADTRTLLDLGLVRRFRGGRARPRIVVQMVDVDHVPLVRLTGPDDWLIDPGATAQLMVQLVDLPQRRDVLLALYDDRGPTLDAVPADTLGLTGSVDAGRVIAAAHAAGLLAIGWFRSRPDGQELVLAPSPDVIVELGPDDSVVVVT